MKIDLTKKERKLIADLAEGHKNYNDIAYRSTKGEGKDAPHHKEQVELALDILSKVL